MILLDGGRSRYLVEFRVGFQRIEMQCREHDQVARPLFEHRIQVPHLEMAAHADQQRTLADAAPRSHPRRDPEPPLAVHLRGRDEPKPPSQQHIARAACHAAIADAVVVVADHARKMPVLVDDIVPIIDQHARIVGVKRNEQVVACAARLYRYAEMLGKKEFASRVDRRDRASHEEIVHDACILATNTVSTQSPDPRSCRIARVCFADRALMMR